MTEQFNLDVNAIKNIDLVLEPVESYLLPWKNVISFSGERRVKSVS